MRAVCPLISTYMIEPENDTSSAGRPAVGTAPKNRPSAPKWATRAFPASTIQKDPSDTTVNEAGSFGADSLAASYASWASPAPNGTARTSSHRAACSPEVACSTSEGSVEAGRAVDAGDPLAVEVDGDGDARGVPPAVQDAAIA